MTKTLKKEPLPNDGTFEYQSSVGHIPERIHPKRRENSSLKTQTLTSRAQAAQIV